MALILQAQHAQDLVDFLHAVNVQNRAIAFFH